MATKTLTDAKKNKNDEFYTQSADIEKELAHYKEHFAGKKVTGGTRTGYGKSERSTGVARCMPLPP